MRTMRVTDCQQQQQQQHHEPGKKKERKKIRNKHTTPTPSVVFGFFLMEISFSFLSFFFLPFIYYLMDPKSIPFSFFSLSLSLLPTIFTRRHG
jgi:hypothetical protein